MTNQPLSPQAANGSDVGDDSALMMALERIGPKVRHPRDAEQRYRNGQFATGNTASQTHGNRSRLTLAKRKAAKLEELRARERDADGNIPWQIDTLLVELSDCLVHGEQASTFINRTAASGETLAGKDYQTGLSVRLNLTDRTARLVALLDSLRPIVAGGRGQFPLKVHKVVFGGRYKPNGQLTGSREPSATTLTPGRDGGQERQINTPEEQVAFEAQLKAEERQSGIPSFVIECCDDPTTMQYLQAQEPDTADLVISSVRTREEMQAYLHPDAEADPPDKPAVVPVMPRPVRVVGTVMQWSGRVGSIQPDCGGALLVARAGQVHDGLALVVGMRVQCVAQDGAARSIGRAPVEGL